MEFEKKAVNEIKKPMNNDYLEIDNAIGMPGLADATLAMEFLQRKNRHTVLRNLFDRNSGSGSAPGNTRLS